MSKPGHIWRRLESQIGAPDIVAISIKRWFKNTVEKSRPGSTVYEQARECTTRGMPRFGNLPIDTQRLLRAEVRGQYPTLSSERTTEKLIEDAFDLVFKGKHQWDMEKERSNQAKAPNNELEPSQPEPSQPDSPPGNSLSISDMLN